MLALKITGCILIALGAVIVFLSKLFVKKFDLVEKQKIKLEDIDEETRQMLKAQKASLMVKLIGMAATVPGAIMIFIAFR